MQSSRGHWPFGAELRLQRCLRPPRSWNFACLEILPLGLHSHVKEPEPSPTSSICLKQYSSAPFFCVLGTFELFYVAANYRFLRCSLADMWPCFLPRSLWVNLTLDIHQGLYTVQLSLYWREVILVLETIFTAQVNFFLQVFSEPELWCNNLLLRELWKFVMDSKPTATWVCIRTFKHPSLGRYLDCR